MYIYARNTFAPKNRVSHLAKYEDYYIHNTTAQK